VGVFQSGTRAYVTEEQANAIRAMKGFTVSGPVERGYEPAPAAVPLAAPMPAPARMAAPRPEPVAVEEPAMAGPSAMPEGAEALLHLETGHEPTMLERHPEPKLLGAPPLETVPPKRAAERAPERRAGTQKTGPVRRPDVATPHGRHGEARPKSPGA
jgi:hypothetical protein